MKKFSKYTLLVLSIVVMIFTLAACSSYKFDAVSGGNKDAATESNGGQVVKQGNMIYFVNGKTDQNVENKFGTVVKGGIYRATVKDNGSLEDFKQIVPKNIFTTGKDAGFYIFGEYIYYLSPSDEKDKDDKPLNNTADIMRVKIDGTDTTKLGYLDALDYQYKFIDGYFVYFKGNKLTICEAEKGLPEVKVIEDVTGIVMPKTETFEKGKEYVTDYIFYTRNLTEEESKDGSRNNILSAIKCDGTNQIDIVTKTTTFSEQANTETKNKNTLTLKNYKVEGANVVVYYTRKNVDGNLSEKLYSYTFSLNDLKQAENKVYFNKANEKTIYDGTVEGFIPYTADSVMEIKDKNIKVYKDNKVKNVTYINEGESGTFPGTYVTFRNEKEGEDNVVMLYYTTSGGMFKTVIERNGVLGYNAPFKIYDGSVGANVFGNELIGDYFYFADTNMFDYVVRIDVTTDTMYTKEKGEGNLNPEKVYVLSDVDQKKLDEADKEKEA